MKETKSFLAFDEERGLVFDESKHPRFPLRYHVIDQGIHSYGPCFGYVATGTAEIVGTGGVKYNLVEGQYFSFPSCQIHAQGLIAVIETLGEDYVPMPHVGGPVEGVGRLKYIDGCTDSLLIPPVKKGDPCLNHLHFPTNIDQTQHTHPSHRIGIVARGGGECITPFGNLDLVPGMVFVIREWDGESFAVGLDGKEYPLGQHSFRTDGETGMDVIAFHPDSDFGPEDEFHPMINRTIIDGKPAKEHEDFDRFKTE